MSNHTPTPGTALATLASAFWWLDKPTLVSMETQFPEIMSAVEQILHTLSIEGVADASWYDVADTLARFNTAIKNLTPNTSEYPMQDWNKYPMQDLNLFFKKDLIDLLAIRNHGSRAVIHMIAWTYGLDRAAFVEHLEKIWEDKRIDPRSTTLLDMAARAFAIIQDTGRAQMITKEDYTRLISPIK
jgi:hypothetical protein